MADMMMAIMFTAIMIAMIVVIGRIMLKKEIRELNTAIKEGLANPAKRKTTLALCVTLSVVAFLGISSIFIIALNDQPERTLYCYACHQKKPVSEFYSKERGRICFDCAQEGLSRLLPDY